MPREPFQKHRLAAAVERPLRSQPHRDQRTAPPGGQSACPKNMAQSSHATLPNGEAVLPTDKVLVRTFRPPLAILDSYGEHTVHRLTTRQIPPTPERPRAAGPDRTQRPQQAQSARPNPREGLSRGAAGRPGGRGWVGIAGGAPSSAARLRAPAGLAHLARRLISGDKEVSGASAGSPPASVAAECLCSDWPAGPPAVFCRVIASGRPGPAQAKGGVPGPTSTNRTNRSGNLIHHEHHKTRR